MLFIGKPKVLRPRVSLNALDGERWYRHVSVQGLIVEIKDDKGPADIDRPSTHYDDQPYPNREWPRVSAWIEVERWHGWGS